MVLSIDLAGNGIGQNLSERRNLLYNAGLFIDQRREFNATPITLTSGTPVYVADGWKVALTQASAVVTSGLVADAPPGFTNSLKVSTTTGATVGAGDSLKIIFPIEGPLMRYLQYGLATAGTATLSYWVKTGGSGAVIHSVALQNSAGNRSYVQVAKIINYGVWTQILIQAIAGDITGTWLTGTGTLGLNLIITLASGTTGQTSTLGAWQATASVAANTIDNKALSVTGATFQVTAPQFEHGMVATPFCLIPYDEDLLFCMRYFQKTFQPGTAPAQNAGLAGTVAIKNPIALGAPGEWIPFKIPMAKNPTLTTYNPSATNANWRDVTASADVTVSVDPITSLGINGVLIATTGTVGTIGDVLAIHWTADAGL